MTNREDTEEFFKKLMDLIDTYDLKNTEYMDRALFHAINYWREGKKNTPKGNPYFAYNLIPDHMMRGIRGYVEDGDTLGGFLTAVFSNDLWKATACADDINLPLLPVYVRYIHNECPAGCHGSLEHIKAWQKKKWEEKQESTTS